MVVPVAASGDAAQLRSGVRGAGAPSGQNGSSSRRIPPIKIAAFLKRGAANHAGLSAKSLTGTKHGSESHPGRQVEGANHGMGVDTTQDREVWIATMMKGTVRLVWLLVTLMVILLPMAWAIPIDPSWITGVYDGGNFDDVVSFLTSGTLGGPVLPAADLSPVFVSAPTEALADQPIGATPLLASHEPRAPPLS